MLFVLLVLIGFAFIYLTSYSSLMYFQEANQRLNADIATHIVDEVPIFTETGAVNEKSLEDMFDHVMTLHPAIEIYLLDPQGKVLAYYAPDDKIKRKYVDLKPIQRFIRSHGESRVMGDDPRHTARQKVFSAAVIQKENKVLGYMYVVLASEELDSVTDVLFGSYLMRVGTYSMLVILVGSFVIGLLLIWYLTRNLRKVMDAVQKFKDGNWQSRVEGHMQGEFGLLANTFNEMSDTLVSNIEQLKALENLRSELIANISHDLRTPIAIIHGYSETLMMKAENLNPAEREKYVGVILKNTENLKRLVADLFEFSKLEAKQVVPQKESFFITELVSDAIQKYTLLAQAKNITLTPVFSQDLPRVYADIAMMDRVLQNLIDNAIKYTPEGGQITVELVKKQNGVEVKISDTGIGISETDLPFIFDRYYKTASPSSTGSSSTGLGLAIVKKILELNNARIEVQSKLNQGTSFMFQLPTQQLQTS